MCSSDLDLNCCATTQNIISELTYFMANTIRVNPFKRRHRTRLTGIGLRTIRLNRGSALGLRHLVNVTRLLLLQQLL